MVSKAIKTTSIVIGSAIGGILLFILATGGYVYFSGSNQDPEVYSKFYDETYEKAFLKALDDAGIPYKRKPDGSVYYSVKYQNKVKELTKAIHSNYPAKFDIYDSKMLSEFEKRLNDAGVKYEKYKTEKGNSIIVDSDYQSMASEAFKEAMGSR